MKILRGNKNKIKEMINYALDQSNPKKFMQDIVHIDKNILSIKDRKINLPKYDKKILIGFGKMASSVAKEICKIVPFDKGIVIDTKFGKIRNKNIKCLVGDHPIPSKKNIKNTDKLIDFVKDFDSNDLVVCIVSGGGSSLLFKPKISYEDYMELYNKKFLSGINIKKLNSFRERESLVKGGRLAEIIFPAMLVNIYFSDVVGGNLSIISSGPTYHKKAENILLLDNKFFLKKMKEKAEALGLKTKIVSDRVSSDIKKFAKKIISGYYPKYDCLIWGGETNIKVNGGGKGGRNQELSLHVAKLIQNKNMTFASFGTDGIDGMTKHAGGIVDGDTVEKINNNNVDLEKELKDNNSNFVLKKVGGLITTAETGINLMDVAILIKGKENVSKK